MADTKDQLLAYIYQHVPIRKLRYTMINSDKIVKYLKANPHYFGFNFYGFNNLLVFVKLKDSYYSFFVDRKTLSYQEKYVDKNRVIINQIKLKVDEKIYRGTILDGIYNFQNNKTFVITDAYYIEGKSYLGIEYKEKMNLVKEYILPKIQIDEDTDKIKFFIDNVYTYNDLKHIDKDTGKFGLIGNKSEKYVKIPLNSRGLIFYPNKSDCKYIFNLSTKKQSDLANVSDDELNEVVPIKHVKDEKKTKKEIMIPIVEEAIMLMKQTNTDGIYELFLKKTNKKYVKIGIAYIKTIKITKLCKSLFKTKDDEVIVSCIWQSKFKKWSPTDHSTKNVNFIDDIYADDE